MQDGVPDTANLLGIRRQGRRGESGLGKRPEIVVGDRRRSEISEGRPALLVPEQVDQPLDGQGLANQVG